MSCPASDARTSFRRIWSETVDFDVLLRSDIVSLIRTYELELLVAIRPWTERKWPEVAKTYSDAGVRVALWPMLSNENGRWANTTNLALPIQELSGGNGVTVKEGIGHISLLFLAVRFPERWKSTASGFRSFGRESPRTRLDSFFADL